MTSEFEIEAKQFPQEPEQPTHYCGARGKTYGFPEMVPAKSPCHSRELWPLEGGSYFAISTDTMMAGAPPLEPAKPGKDQS